MHAVGVKPLLLGSVELYATGGRLKAAFDQFSFHFPAESMPGWVAMRLVIYDLGLKVAGEIFPFTPSLPLEKFMSLHPMLLGGGNHYVLNKILFWL